MSRVFIVCEPQRRNQEGKSVKLDLSPASEWGEPIILLAYDQSLPDATKTIRLLTDKLATFCDNDYLVPIGDPVLMCAATAVAAFRNSGRVKLLKWDRKHSAYFPIQLDIKEPICQTTSARV